MHSFSASWTDCFTDLGQILRHLGQETDPVGFCRRLLCILDRLRSLRQHEDADCWTSNPGDCRRRANPAGEHCCQRSLQRQEQEPVPGSARIRLGIRCRYRTNSRWGFH